MTRLIVEDGSGVLKANSYAGLAYAYTYLRSRNRSTNWQLASVEDRTAALIAATDYVDKRFGLSFLGYRVHHQLPTFASNSLVILSQPSDGDQIMIGTNTFTFRDVASGAGSVLIGMTPADTAVSLAIALSDSDLVVAEADGESVLIEAIDSGPTEPIETSSLTAAIDFEFPRLVGGSLAGSQPLEFPRTAFEGIPDVLKMATVEYATRALTMTLMPDPEVDASGQQVRRRSEKVGPVEEEVVYQNSKGEIFLTFPEADMLIRPLVTSEGRVYR